LSSKIRSKELNKNEVIPVANLNAQRVQEEQERAFAVGDWIE
jgi:hypothetical protein